MSFFFSPTPSVSVAEAAQRAAAGDAILIDVRMPDEYAAVHAAGALNCPLPSLASCLEKLKRFKAVYVICQSGGRSARATAQLMSQEINAINVSGGTLAWQAHGLPLG